MLTLQALLDDKQFICEIAKKLGFINVRVFKGMTPKEQGNLNLLVDLDPNNPKANYLNTDPLAEFLQRQYRCIVAVCTESQLTPFYKNTILANNAQLSGEDANIRNVYKQDITFNSLPIVVDKRIRKARTDNLEIATQIILEYDRLEQIKSQIAALSETSKASLLDWLLPQCHQPSQTSSSTPTQQRI